MLTMQLVKTFKRPKDVEFKKDIDNPYKGLFLVKPYEKGFGITIGNSIRRTLLSSISGHSIVAFKSDGIKNEFENIAGVYHDTTEILVNFKNVHIGLVGEEVNSRVLRFDIKGKKDFYAKDLAVDKGIIIGNGDKLLFSANETSNFSFEIQINKGTGYVDSEVFVNHINTEGAIVIDGNFSPVLNVSFSVEPLNSNEFLGEEYEKLEMEIVTNGVVSSEKALERACQILKESYFTFTDIEETAVTSPVSEEIEKQYLQESIYQKSVYTLPFSVRTHFFLKFNEIREIGELVLKTEDEIKEKAKFNNYILEDIQQILASKSMNLGMTNINYVRRNLN